MAAIPLIDMSQDALPDGWRDAPLADPAAPHLVLIVDDSKMQTKILSSSLRKWGYEVMEAASGFEALEICRTHDVSIVLSDWVMPGMNGPEFCAEYRKLNHESYGYFILLTSKSEKNDVTLGLNSGADDFLTKPVNSSELQARLRAGERVVTMQAQVVEKNRMLNETLDTIREIYDSLDRDLSEARKLQQSLVRDTEITLETGQVSMVLTPSGHIGGDLVGQFRINDHQVALYSLDVSGHGVSSALLTARLAAYFSSSSPTQNVAITQDPDGTLRARDPSETAAHLNAVLLSELQTEHYFTMALAILDEVTGRVTCVQAGHPHPIVQRKGQMPEICGAGGPPIGLLPDVSYQSFEINLQAGDRLVLYSDGVTECANPQGQLLDEAGLITLLHRHEDASGAELLQDLDWELHQFTGTKDLSDDVSALVLQFDGPKGARPKSESNA